MNNNIIYTQNISLRYISPLGEIQGPKSPDPTFPDTQTPQEPAIMGRFSPPPPHGASGDDLHRALSEYGAEFSETLLHFWNAGQSSFELFLLLTECESCGRVQHLHTPATLPVELEEVGMESPVEGGRG